LVGLRLGPSAKLGIDRARRPLWVDEPGLGRERTNSPRQRTHAYSGEFAMKRDDSGSTTQTPAERIRSTKRLLKFSIRGLLFATTVLAIAIGMHANRVASQSRATSDLGSVGGYMKWEPNRLGRWLPTFMTSRLDQNVWMRPYVAGLTLRRGKSEWKAHTSEEIKQFAAALDRLPHVRNIHLEVAGMTNEVLAAIAPMGEQIETLSIANRFYMVEDVPVRLPETLDVKSLASFRNLEILKIRGAKLDRAQFEQISKLVSLRGIQLDSCRFVGDDFLQLGVLPNLEAVKMHNVVATSDLLDVGQLDFPQPLPNELGLWSMASGPRILFIPSIEFTKYRPLMRLHLRYGPKMIRILPNAEVHMEEGLIMDVEQYFTTEP
jgi:hypothetical protein